MDFSVYLRVFVYSETGYMGMFGFAFNVRSGESDKHLRFLKTLRFISWICVKKEFERMLVLNYYSLFLKM